MTGTAAGPVGPRRASGGEVVLVVAALLLAPRLFVIAPLAGLLAAARPSSGRGRFYAVLAIALVAAGVASTTGLLDRLVTAWAVLTAGTFAVLSWRGAPGTLFTRALLSVSIGGALVSLFAGMQGVTWEGLERYASREIASALTTMLQSGGDDPQAAQALAPLQAQVPLLAALLPAQLFLGQLIGLVLAWRWHEWSADRPLGPASGAFAEFRFGEWGVWVVIVALALLLFGASGAVWSASANALLIMAACYAARGAAVLAAKRTQIGFVAGVLYIIAAIILAVFVTASLIALGLADNWFDFRRRTPDSSSRDQTSWK